MRYIVRYLDGFRRGREGDTSLDALDGVDGDGRWRERTQ